MMTYPAGPCRKGNKTLLKALGDFEPIAEDDFQIGLSRSHVRVATSLVNPEARYKAAYCARGFKRRCRLRSGPDGLCPPSKHFLRQHQATCHKPSQLDGLETSSSFSWTQRERALAVSRLCFLPPRSAACWTLWRYFSSLNQR